MLLYKDFEFLSGKLFFELFKLFLVLYLNDVNCTSLIKPAQNNLKQLRKHCKTVLKVKTQTVQKQHKAILSYF